MIRTPLLHVLASRYQMTYECLVKDFQASVVCSRQQQQQGSASRYPRQLHSASLFGQVENAKDIAKNFEQREKTDGASAHHTLKLALGDGRQTVRLREGLATLEFAQADWGMA